MGSDFVVGCFELGGAVCVPVLPVPLSRPLSSLVVPVPSLLFARVPMGPLCVCKLERGPDGAKTDLRRVGSGARGPKNNKRLKSAKESARPPHTVNHKEAQRVG